MAKGQPNKGNGNKQKATKLDITQLVVTSAYSRTFKTGRTGWFGQALNPATGERFQIIGAVKIA